MVSPYMNETFSEWKAFNNKQKRNTKINQLQWYIHVKWNNFKQDGKVNVSSTTDLLDIQRNTASCWHWLHVEHTVAEYNRDQYQNNCRVIFLSSSLFSVCWKPLDRFIGPNLTQSGWYKGEGDGVLARPLKFHRSTRAILLLSGLI